jgi:hypothetical protein
MGADAANRSNIVRIKPDWCRPRSGTRTYLEQKKLNQ